MWSTFFIRTKWSLLRDSQRMATTNHGALLTLIDPETLVTTLTASWAFKLIAQGQDLLFKSSWFTQFAEICSRHEYRSLDHMINCRTINWNKVSLEKIKCKSHLFVHQSIVSLCKMGLKRDPVLVFEDLMNQHLFGNSHIIDPDTRLPWNKQRSIFKVIPDTRLLTIADLYINFKHLDYKLNPCVHPILQPDLRKANAHFSTRKRHIVKRVLLDSGGLFGGYQRILNRPSFYGNK